MFSEALCLEVAEFFVLQKSTVRKTAKYFNISKSSVHNYLHKNLKRINFKLYKKVQAILDKNGREKHIRGGEATREKFKIIHSR